MVLATVILVLFGDKIKPKKAELVRHILEARRDYAESALESLNEGRFAPRCENLAYSLRTLSSSLGDDIEAKCKEFINRGVDDITNDNFTKLLNMHGLKIKTLSDIYQEKMQDLKKSVQTLKEAGIEFSEEQVLELKIVILGVNEEKKKLVEDDLTMVLKAAITNSENRPKFADVRQEIENLLGPLRRSAVIRAEDVEQKCIILSIRCSSCHDVIELLDYIGSTLFQEHFFILSDEMSTLHEDLFVISASLTLDSLYKSLIKAGDVEGEMTSQSERMAHIQDYKFKHVDKGVKVFNDSIHGLIELHPLCVEIINTPEFERLRFIKQLGASYFVYPGAAHNRFEHSIGVCYLAGTLVEAIRKRQPELKLTDQDVLCVQIAGLCHDMGHGPFSHVFDNVVLPKLVEGTTWKHEKGSVDMFSYMRKNNPDLAARFKEYGIEDKEMDFINELIFGPNGQDYSNWLKTTTKGKSENENERTHVFLYEVVNNKRNEIDVDKWDYFARDCYMLGMGISFDYKRCIAFSRVIEVQGEWQICYRDKEYNNLLEMFEIRYQLHRRAYKHKTVNGIEMMIAEALVAAHEHITFIGTDGSAKKMSETIEDMAAFSLMTDEVFYRILNDPNPELITSKELLLRVLKRDIYLQVAEKPCGPTTYDKEFVKKEIRDIMHVKKGEEPFEIDIVNLNYGRGIKNPVSFVNFYKKDNINHAEPIHEEDVSRLLPKKWAELHVRIYSKSKENREAVRAAFMTWKVQ